MNTIHVMVNLIMIKSRMGEPEARRAILKGFVTINDIEYIVHPQSSGSCDGCVFEDEDHCPKLALDICCTGGNILKYKL